MEKEVKCFKQNVLYKLLLYVLYMYPLLSWSGNNDTISSKHNESFSTERPLVMDHTLCVIVPFRDRYKELEEFAPYMYKFLDKQNIKHEVWVVNQVDGYRFNRASLINVGFIESSDTCDYIAIHDVDLLPLNSALTYKFPKGGPFHVASYKLHPNYVYPEFLGGILLISRNDFKLINGMSNRYWGWGLEDDELYHRISQANLTVERPEGISTGRTKTFRHMNSIKRVRDVKRCYNQLNVTSRRDRETGLSTTVYEVEDKKQVNFKDVEVNFVDVKLKCDMQLTPWCNCTGAPNEQRRIRADGDSIIPNLSKRRQ